MIFEFTLKQDAFSLYSFIPEIQTLQKLYGFLVINLDSCFKTVNVMIGLNIFNGGLAGFGAISVALMLFIQIISEDCICIGLASESYKAHAADDMIRIFF